SPDSIVPEPGSSGGFNRYRYTRNNPLKYVDPTGHYTLDPDTGECFGGDCDRNPLAPPDDEVDKNGINPEFDPDNYWRKEVPSREPIWEEGAYGLSVIATGLDVAALHVSLLAATAAYGTAYATATGPVGYAAVSLAYQASPLRLPEDLLGLAALGAVIGSDYLAGNSYSTDNGVVIGRDTYVATGFMVAGLFPDVTTDVGINVAAVYYDSMSLRDDPLLELLPGNIYMQWGLNAILPAPKVPTPPSDLGL
ncbi:MAG: hypothetical protein GY797_30660, partial [Deltaproteobacteria bacterium]|nr:hypothetical protein [Deltaproteobacteria bacterium]